VIIPALMTRHLLLLAERAAPKEAVAVIGFDRDTMEPRSVVPLANRAADPRDTFFVMPHEHYDADMALRKTGQYIGAIFHSHPTTQPRPSVTDLEMCEPNVYMLIAGREPSQAADSAPIVGWVLRAWNGSREVPIHEAMSEAA
jgi:proteasome lid subunit RPN8/RPN11